MKRTLFYVTAIVSLILFAACSKDDSNDLVITSSKEIGLNSQETLRLNALILRQRMRLRTNLWQQFQRQG